MDTLLLLLALIGQTADTAVSCRQLARGEREANPVLRAMHATTCDRIAAVKGAALLAIPFVPEGRARRWYLGSLAVSGGVGVALSLKY